MSSLPAPARKPLETRKFRHPERTADGQRRASVALQALRTLWFNTGTLCNLTCANCYIESSPRNDRLAYLSLDEVRAFLDEIASDALPTREIGFTGGEPFLNREFVPMLALCLERGFEVLVLTNAMKPMRRKAAELLELRERHGDRLTVRVSLDHYGPALHEMERGKRTWAATLDGLRWLARNGFRTHVAGRTFSGESEADLRRGYARLFAAEGIGIDAFDPSCLILFPEMDLSADVPEITEACWGILGVSPDAMMCASSRMVAKRKGAASPVVLACTLVPYEAVFELGRTLRDAAGSVPLNHPHCARFCVLGGGSCSRS